MANHRLLKGLAIFFSTHSRLLECFHKRFDRIAEVYPEVMATHEGRSLHQIINDLQKAQSAIISLIDQALDGQPLSDAKKEKVLALNERVIDEVARHVGLSL